MNHTQLSRHLIHEPSDVYHARAVEYLSSHRLAEFRRCPLLYRMRQDGLLDEEDRPSYLVGRAAHTLILEGREKFAANYAIGGPINEKTGQPYGPTTKAFADWAAAQGKPVLTHDQAEIIKRMAASVAAHELADSILTDGIAEGVVRSPLNGVPCQIRVDWFNASHQAIVDLKTSDDLTFFESDARRYGYAHQMAFYRSVLAAAAQIDTHEIRVYMVAVEKREPFRVGVWLMSEHVLAIAQRENDAAIERLKWCRDSKLWPTGYEELRIFSVI